MFMLLVVEQVIISLLLQNTYFSRFAGKKVEHVMASEMKYSSRYIIPNSTLFAISQSGESADILEELFLLEKRRMQRFCLW